MKPVLSLACDHLLAELLADLEAGRERLVGGGDGLHDLEQRHHLRRVEEMQPEEAIRARGRRGLVDHRERGGVGREPGVLLDDRVDRLPHLELRPEVLADRLDHEVAVGEGAVVGRALDPGADGVGLVALHPALLHGPGKLLLDLADALADLVVVDFAHDDVPARLGADLGDPVAHQATTDDSNLADCHVLLGLLVCQGRGPYRRRRDEVIRRWAD